MKIFQISLVLFLFFSIFQSLNLSFFINLFPFLHVFFSLASILSFLNLSLLFSPDFLLILCDFRSTESKWLVLCEF